jgi:hypothetical protein
MFDDAHIDAHGHPVTVFSDHTCAPGGVFESSCSEKDPCAARSERTFQRRVVIDAAGQFHVDVELLDHRGQQWCVCAPAEGCIEVDEMNPFGASCLSSERSVGWIAMSCRGPDVALGQSHGPPTSHVDGWKQGKRHSSNTTDRKSAVHLTRMMRFLAGER